MNLFRPPTDGAKFDYSKIQDITKNMKEKLKQKYESLTNVQTESQTGSQENATQSSVLDNYITDIENLFLDGVFNGNLYVRGTIYADKVETTETSDSNEKTEVKANVNRSFDAIKEWTKRHLKEARIEDSEIWRTRFYNADFVNETLFRDTVRMERDLNIYGAMNLNGDLLIDTNVLFVDSSNNRVGINTSNPSIALDISGSMAVDTNVLYVDSSNNRVGVGTSNPSKTLEISGNTRVSSILDVSGSANITGNLAVDTNVLFVDSDNNRIGIGTSNPSKTLEISGNVRISSSLDVSSVISAPNANIPIGFRVETFTTGTGVSWTVPDGVYYLIVSGTAGGGGGGLGDDANFSVENRSGSGGGAGATQIWRGSVSPGSILTITVGTGGSGSSSATVVGGSGTSTVVSISDGRTIINSGGGAGGRTYIATNGTYNGRGGDGGSQGTSLAQIRIDGGDGFTSTGFANSSLGAGSNGGASYWGSGARGGTAGTNPPNARVYGTGGGGGRYDQNGSSGAGGVVIIEY